jgi:hypothetical protein
MKEPHVHELRPSWVRVWNTRVSPLLIHTSASSSATLMHPLPLPLLGWAASITFTSSPPEALPPPRLGPPSPASPHAALGTPQLENEAWGLLCFSLVPSKLLEQNTHTHTHNHREGQGKHKRRQEDGSFPPRAGGGVPGRGIGCQ